MYLDIFIAVIIVAAILTGLRNGMYVEFISIFGLFLNVMITKTYTPDIISFFKIKLLNNNYVLTYLVVFICVYLFIKMILVIASRVLRENSRGILTKGIGAFIGFTKGFILAFILLLVYNFSSDYAPSIRKYSEGSQANVIFAELLPHFEKFIPDIFVDKLNEIRNRNFIEKVLRNQRKEYENNESVYSKGM